MRQFIFLALIALGLSGLSRADMVSLDDQTLSHETGGVGIALQLATYINMDPTTGTVLTGTVGGSNFGSPGCTGTNNPCKLAIQFANRTGAISGTVGQWLVLKDYYGLISIPTLYLDAYTNPASATAFANKARFQNSAGNCPYVASCSPAGMQSFKLSFPTSGGYNDISMFLNIGRVAIQYDTTSACQTNVNDSNCGYNKDLGATNSFLGLQVGDISSGLTNIKPAQIKVDGQVRVYGF